MAAHPIVAVEIAAMAFASSASAYNDINATLGSFYQEPEEDPEKEALKAEVEQLKQAAAVQQPAQMTYEEQVTLLEKSYEFAAKYTPGGGGANTGKQGGTRRSRGTGRRKPFPWGWFPLRWYRPCRSPSAIPCCLQGCRNRGGFIRQSGNTEAGSMRNTVRACIHGDQTVISGQGVRMRLLEPMRVGKHVLPKTPCSRERAAYRGERLNIGIVQVEYDGIIIPVELTVYDNDGQDGIFIPGSMEASAVKEVAANMGQNLGTSISITNQSAEDQLLSELGRGAIQGVSQYISKKLREEKVHLKSGHTLMLYQNDNQ